MGALPTLGASGNPGGGLSSCHTLSRLPEPGRQRRLKPAATAPLEKNGQWPHPFEAPGAFKAPEAWSSGHRPKPAATAVLGKHGRWHHPFKAPGT
jgi:hypothetical protein